MPPSQRSETVTSDKQHPLQNFFGPATGKVPLPGTPSRLLTNAVSRGSEDLLLVGDETRFLRELTYCSQNLETQLARGNVLYFPELWCNLENNTKGFVCLGSDF